MAEYIDKEDVLDLIHDWSGESAISYLVFYPIYRELMKLPSADVVERKTGRWIKPASMSDWVLSECPACGFDTGAHTFKFCPNCGADMREES